MKINVSLRHFESALTVADIEEVLKKKFAFLERSVKDESIVEFKIKKKNSRMNEEVKLPKNVYEVRVSGRTKTGNEFFLSKQSTDLKKAIDKLAAATKENVDAAVFRKQNRGKPERVSC